MLGQQGLDTAVFGTGSQLGGLWSFGNDNGMSSICRSLNININININTSNRMAQLLDCP